MGPRPPLPSEVAQYDARAMRRLSVKPGLTGYWQVRGRSDTGFEEMVDLVFRHLDATVFFADALSVGLFALAGASKAFSLEQGFVLSVILGAITAVGGGAVRDICVGETPGIFQQSNFYAVAGLGGSFAFVALAYAGSPLPLAGVACVFVVVFLRYWSVYFDWKTSNEADLTPHVARGVGKVRRVVSGVFLHGGDATVAQKERRRRGRWRRNHEKRD